MLVLIIFINFFTSKKIKIKLKQNVSATVRVFYSLILKAVVDSQEGMRIYNSKTSCFLIKNICYRN